MTIFYKKASFIAIFLFFVKINVFTQVIPFEQNSNRSATYVEAIEYYKYLAKAYKKNIRIENNGLTDSEFPLQTIVIANRKAFTPELVRAQGKCVLLINNGIHPGESDGIDASMLFVRDLLQKPDNQHLLDHVTIVVIPVYNIDGALNRNTSSRANQNGPEAYGFRGNGQNLDLNRDFVKCDTRNAQSFNSLFTHWMPDVMIDNHVSNGADYQYVMTLIPTEHSKLAKPLADYLDTEMLPNLYQNMAKTPYELSPYVNSLDYDNEIPDVKGIAGFMDSPRYSTGYAALHHCIGFMPETHMLKPYKDRVLSTYQLMFEMLKIIDNQHIMILNAKQKAIEESKTKRDFPIRWVLDELRVDSLLFKGYVAKWKPSDISGLPRLWYDRAAPYTKNIPYFGHYKATLSVTKPKAYIVPKAWYKVLARLQQNGVKLQPLAHDTTLNVEIYTIKDMKTATTAYEGHYVHSKVEVESKQTQKTYTKGDYWVSMLQDANRFALETLEPQSPDSYFAWNYFDGILMPKEYFSTYVFEDLAAQYLASQPNLQAEFKAKQATDKVFAADAAAQLDWVYKRSPYYYDRNAFMVYPVGRVVRDDARNNIPKF